MFFANAEMHTGWLTGVLLNFARGGAEWILWLLVLMSMASFIVFAERLVFLNKSAADGDALRLRLIDRLRDGRTSELLTDLKDGTSMQARVVSYGLRDAHRGPEAVLELCRGALGVEKLRYERGLSILATIGSNAPFVGLFGTVMGVIMAFDTGQSSAVMGAIAEALVATGVGLLVAIPAIIFFNVLKGRIKSSVSSTGLLVDTMVAYLRSETRVTDPGKAGE